MLKLTTDNHRAASLRQMSFLLTYAMLFWATTPFALYVPALLTPCRDVVIKPVRQRNRSSQ